MTDRERQALAFHEAAHAAVRFIVSGWSAVGAVEISCRDATEPRGRAHVTFTAARIEGVDRAFACAVSAAAGAAGERLADAPRAVLAADGRRSDDAKVEAIIAAGPEVIAAVRVALRERIHAEATRLVNANAGAVRALAAALLASPSGVVSAQAAQTILWQNRARDPARVSFRGCLRATAT